MDITYLKNISKDISILYVEDEGEIRDSVQKYLEKIFEHVTVAKDGQDGLKLYQEKSYDIVLTDIQMPYMNGLEMASEIKSINLNQEIIIVSAYSEEAYFLDAIRLGINGYILKPINYIHMNQILHKSIFNINNYKENIKYKKHLEEQVELRTHETLALEEEKIENFEKTLTSFVTMIEDRDTYTDGHSQRVANYSLMIAKKLQCTDKECDLLYRAGILHDIGKITTPDSILLKPGKLNELEYKIIQQHVTESHDILLKIPMYIDMAEIIVCHHEHYDGTGYPKGLKSGEIPFLARIMIIADAFDAMTTNRIYKARKNTLSAIEEIKALSGKHFHPEIVNAAVEVLKEVKDIEIYHQLPKTDVEKARFSYFYRDQLTNAYNIDYLDVILNRNTFEKKYFCINSIKMHNFHHYNEKNGWSQGDKVLKRIVAELNNFFSSSVLIFRVHGNDFIIVGEEHINVNLEELAYFNTLKQYNISFSQQHIDLHTHDVHDINTLEKLIL